MFIIFQTCGSSGKSYTYEQGRDASARFASALINELGLKKGDVIGILLPNMPEYVIAIHGAIQAGIVATFVNPLYTPGKYLQIHISDLFIFIIDKIDIYKKIYRSTIEKNQEEELKSISQ